jgi:hypothetical protein
MGAIEQPDRLFPRCCNELHVTFREAVENEDILSLGTAFAVSFFVFPGAMDKVTPVAPVRAYVDMISGPSNELVLIPTISVDVLALLSVLTLSIALASLGPLASWR